MCLKMLCTRTAVIMSMEAPLEQRKASLFAALATWIHIDSQSVLTLCGVLRGCTLAVTSRCKLLWREMMERFSLSAASLGHTLSLNQELAVAAEEWEHTPMDLEAEEVCEANIY